MADGDTLTTLGQKLTDLFASAYAGGDPGSFVFLPFSVPAPDNILQDGIVNPTRLAAFLVANFDAPYLLSPDQGSAHGRDASYGMASQIYATAVALARTTAPPDSDVAKRVNAEIMMARSVLSPTGPAVAMACQPDDWVALGNASYWTIFDSTQTQGAAPPSPPPSTPSTPSPPTGDGGGPGFRPRIFDRIWTIKPEAAEAEPVSSLDVIHAAAPALARPMIADVVAQHPSLMAATTLPIKAEPALQLERELAIRPAVLAQTTPAIRTIEQLDATELPTHRLPAGVSPVVRPGLRWPLEPPPVRPPAPSPPPPPPPSSTVTVHFEHMPVTIGYMAAGISIWNGVFLADRNWCIPGMPRGGLLPSPSIAAAPPAAPAVYGLPTSLIVVRNVAISVKWSGQEKSALGSSGGFLGPFSLAGVSPSQAPDGTWTYSRPGMQVVALLCSHLPVLPPIDAPDLTPTGPAAPSKPSEVLMALQQLGVDYSVPEADLRDLLGNTQYTSYPAIAQALLTLLHSRPLRQPVYFDVIVWNYEHSPGSRSPREVGDVDPDLLKKAILEGYNGRHSPLARSFDEILR
jgi:hypothetical protein